MKLSELSTDQAADVLCELAPHVSSIVGDKALLDELSKKLDTKSKSVAEIYTFAAKKYALLVPILLKDHREDVFGVLAILNETDMESVGKQNIIETMRQVKEFLSDKDLMDFFASQGPETA